MLPSPVDHNAIRSITELATSFARATPVRHVILDGFLEPQYAAKLFEDLPSPELMPKSRDYLFSDKRELSTLDLHSQTSRQLHDMFMSPEFAGFLSELTGREVFVDPEYVGGGFHAGAHSSYLDLHVDFNIHPKNRTWLRELNILLYLNPGWEPAWGGHLLLVDDPEGIPKEVAPLFNRLVVMESTDSSFHGYREIHFPHGRARRSIAAYAYSEIDPRTVSRRTTRWVPQSAGPLKRSLARNWNWMVRVKNRFLGSGTLKNRR